MLTIRECLRQENDIRKDSKQVKEILIAKLKEGGFKELILDNPKIGDDLKVDFTVLDYEEDRDGNGSLQAFERTTREATARVTDSRDLFYQYRGLKREIN